MPPSLLIPLLLLACSIGLIVWHMVSWRRARREELEAEERDYRSRQYRRRMQTSSLLALLAVALFVGQWIRWPAWLFLCYWGGVLLLLGWVGLLAAADMFATRHHYARLRQEYAVEQARLKRELRRLEDGEDNEG